MNDVHLQAYPGEPIQALRRVLGISQPATVQIVDRLADKVLGEHRPQQLRATPPVSTRADIVDRAHVEELLLLGTVQRALGLVLREHGVSDGEHAAMHPVKAPRSDATTDRAGAQPERDELPARDDAVLLQRTLRDRSIKGGLASCVQNAATARSGRRGTR